MELEFFAPSKTPENFWTKFDRFPLLRKNMKSSDAKNSNAEEFQILTQLQNGSYANTKHLFFASKKALQKAHFSLHSQRLFQGAR